MHLAPASLISMVILLTGCPQSTAIWLKPGSTRDSLAFVISDKRGGERPIAFGVLRIEPCEASNRPVWLIWDSLGAWTKVREVEYGRLPEHFGEQEPAHSLEPGCYRALISGIGRLEFKVTAAGAVSEVPKEVDRDQ
jgi:hypothetical protein